MKKQIISKLADFLIALLVYLALFTNNDYTQYAQNLLMPVLWILIILALISALILANDEFKESFKKDRKPKSTLGIYYSVFYDLLLGGVLIAMGYTFTGVTYWIVYFIAASCILSVDNEIKNAP